MLFFSPCCGYYRCFHAASGYVVLLFCPRHLDHEQGLVQLPDASLLLCLILTILDCIPGQAEPDSYAVTLEHWVL